MHSAGMALVCGGLLFVCLAQPLIQLEGLLVHQRHLGHGWVQGIKQQVAGLGWFKRGD